MVAPVERSERSTIAGLHGKPSSRCSLAEGAGVDALDVVGVVGEGELLAGGGGRDVQVAEPGRLDPLAQPRVLGHREAVARRERQHELIGVEDLHAGASLA
jgi:hypothetical protein